MKKFILLLAVVTAIAVSSCSKEKNCKCTQSMEGMDDVVTELTIQDGDCSDSDMTQTIGTVQQTLKCVEQ